MAIGPGWHTEEGWKFHVDTKSTLRKWVDDTSNFNILRALTVDEKWIYPKQEDLIPANYTLLLRIFQEYNKIYTTFKPSLVERLIAPKFGITVLTLYKEDSAYLERIGGVITCMLDERNYKEFDNEETRYNALVGLHEWWKRNDKRPRSLKWVGAIWEEFLSQYQTNEFVKTSADFIIDSLLDNRDNWEYMERFNPNMWYPYGSGPVNFIIHGRGMN